MALVIIINNAIVRFGGVNIGLPGKLVTLLFFAPSHNPKDRMASQFKISTTSVASCRTPRGFYQRTASRVHRRGQGKGWPTAEGSLWCSLRLCYAYAR